MFLQPIKAQMGSLSKLRHWNLFVFPAFQSCCEIALPLALLNVQLTSQVCSWSTFPAMEEYKGTLRSWQQADGRTSYWYVKSFGTGLVHEKKPGFFKLCCFLLSFQPLRLDRMGAFERISPESSRKHGFVWSRAGWSGEEHCQDHPWEGKQGSLKRQTSCGGKKKAAQVFCQPVQAFTSYCKLCCTAVDEKNKQPRCLWKPIKAVSKRTKTASQSRLCSSQSRLWVPANKGCAFSH